MKSNLILTGMPGAGKSTVGVILAKVLGFDFVDVDILIAKRQGQTLQEILDTQGIDAFLQIEAQEGASLHTEKTVIATGGSMILSDAAMTHLKGNGLCIYLDVSPDTLVHRLTNMETRGIAAAADTGIEQIYAERHPRYQRYADLTIDCQDLSMEEVVAEIVKQL